MTAHRHLWGPDFPERESRHLNGSVPTGAYLDLAFPPGPLMCELTTDRAVWIFRGPLAPANTAGALRIAPEQVVRFEVTANDRRVWAQPFGRQTLSWAARIWFRYEPFVAPRLPQRHLGDLVGDNDADRYWFSHGLGPASGFLPPFPDE